MASTNPSTGRILAKKPTKRSKSKGLAARLVAKLLRKKVPKSQIATALSTTERSIDRIRLDGAVPRPKRLKALQALAKRQGITVPS